MDDHHHARDYGIAGNKKIANPGDDGWTTTTTTRTPPHARDYGIAGNKKIANPGDDGIPEN